MLTRTRKFLQRIALSQELVATGFISLAVVIVALSTYGYARITTLSGQVAELSAELATTTALLNTSIADATSSFSDALAQTSEHVQNQLSGVQDQVGVIGGAVTDLKKLSDTDPQLLAKYSKIFFLNENYTPARLVAIPSDYKYVTTKDLQIIPQVLSYMTKMLDAAKQDGVELYVDSSYRSFNTQAALKSQYKVVYGAGTANQFSADQGYSEHQLGTAADFITTGTGGVLSGFDTRPAYAWMIANAWRYGFILSYPKNNGYYIFEPWHWRFVGVKLATDLHTTGTYFYEMGQRTIDTYLSSFFD
jgi:LAS superfamily LD-carboxypeptidase LdcB